MKDRSKTKSFWQFVVAIVTVLALIKELRMPSSERTWHGKVADFVPYDFRMPTLQRFRDTYWDPEGPIISSQVFGVGWTVNVGALASRFRS